ncbi:PorV/PorQ family protein [Gracilimonas sp.]|uniref:PorV/PorQ family protein n=1 Tax=Gracilimonas sp. TaxID=1974203 RepID=UPI0032EFA3A8
MKTGFFVLFFSISSTVLFAQGSGFEVLSISPTPYSLSKAEATTSISEGSASIFSNPALLSLNDHSSIDLGYSFWIANVNNIFGGVNFRNEQRAIAFSFYTSGADDYESRNNPGPPNGEFSIQYISIAAAYSYDFKYFALGGAFQYLNEENFTYQANGYAFNFGIASELLDEMVRVGASVTNLGEMEKLNINATPLPTNFKAGTSVDVLNFTPPKNDDLPVLLTAYADFVHPLVETDDKDYADYTVPGSYFNLGLSFTVAEVLQISGGYKTQNNVRPISFGAAFSTDEITFNYALVPFNTGYGTVHSIGIQYKF